MKATARPAKRVITTKRTEAPYKLAYAMIDFKDGSTPKPHPVIIRLSDFMMIPCTHNPNGKGAVALPTNWKRDGKRAPAYAKPAHVGHYPLSPISMRVGLEPLNPTVYPIADEILG